MATPFNQTRRCPFIIGRGAQLSSLSQAFEQVGGGQGQTLLVTGEAGIGKSRLVAEAKAMANQQEWLILGGHCFEPDSILPYAPLLDLLGTLLSDLSPSDAGEVFGAEARDLLKILPELARCTPALTPFSALDPAQERRLAIQGIYTVVTRLASRKPVLAIVEDLHWSDDTSLDALLHVARRVAGSPLLLMLTYRDDEIGGDLSHFLATVDRERLASELTLHRLDAAEVGTMVTAIVADGKPTPAIVRDTLHALTDGNPFFIEEVLNVLQWGDDEPSLNGWPEPTAVDELRVPRSVHDAVHRRVDQLSPGARRVLQLASVAGRRWDFSMLQSLTDHDESGLLGLVKELIAAQLVVEEAEDRFAFRHALTQKAVYTQLLAREQRRLHQTIAEAYEQLRADTGDRHLADLTYHFYEAGDWRRALDYASRAGEQALGLYAAQAAVEQFSRALDAAQRLSRSPEPRLYRARGLSHETLGNFEGARADYEASLAVAREMKDQRNEWQALLDLGLLWSGRDYERTAEYCQRALALARTIADPIIVWISARRSRVSQQTCFKRPGRDLRA